MKGTIAFALLAGLLLAVPFASACSCIPPRTPTEEFTDADAVFIGTVLEFEKSVIGEATATVNVTRSLKGVSSAQVQVLTAADSAGCGFPFEEGEDYLIYADGPPLQTGLCSRTATLENAQLDLAELGAGTPIGPAASSLLGLETVITLLVVVIIVGIALAVLIRTGRIPKPALRRRSEKEVSVTR